MENTGLFTVVGAVVAFLLLAPKFLFGLVVIDERTVGIVIKKFSSKSLKDGALIALNGEAGYQAAHNYSVRGNWPHFSQGRKANSV